MAFIMVVTLIWEVDPTLLHFVPWSEWGLGYLKVLSPHCYHRALVPHSVVTPLPYKADVTIIRDC